MKRRSFRGPVCCAGALPCLFLALAASAQTAGGFGMMSNSSSSLLPQDRLRQLLGSRDSSDAGGMGSMGTMGTEQGLGTAPGGPAGLPGTTGPLQPWNDQAGQLLQRLQQQPSSSSLLGDESLAAEAPPPSSPLLPGGATIRDPYASDPALKGAGIPGANSPFTSTGNAAGFTPYRDYDKLLSR